MGLSTDWGGAGEGAGGEGQKVKKPEKGNLGWGKSLLINVSPKESVYLSLFLGM